METDMNAPAEMPAEKPDGEAEIPESRRALVSDWLERIKEAKDHRKLRDAFKRMKECQRIAASGSSDKAWVDSGAYVLPVINRHINLAVAQLYAKDPTIVVKRKPRMLYKVWDEKPETAQQALAAFEMGDMTQTPLLEDIMAGQQYMMLLDKMARSLEIAWNYFMSEQKHNYKAQLKAAVRRAKVNGVAYAKLGYQRILETNPEITAGIADVTSKIKHLESLIAASEDPERQMSPDDKTLEELRLNLQDLQQQETLLVREGPTISFPRSDALIFDPETVHLKTWAGCGWVAEEMDKSPDDVRKTWGKNLGKNFRTYKDGGRKNGKTVARIYEVWDLVAQQKFVVCEGHDDFIEEPATPAVLLERFNPYFPLVFNEVECDDEVIPPSDVWLTRHPQDEMNRAREGVRQHRRANMPFYGMSKGVLPADDVNKLGSHAAHEVIQFQIPAEQDINKVVRKFDHAAIDPAQYDVEGHMSDVMRTVGTQEANLGPTSGATATETSIAENSRQSSTSDNVDDLDEWLTEITKSGGHLMLMQLQKDTVTEIVGPGAAWPDAPQTREEVAKDLSLEIEAGSSGRPNNAAELANMERAAPTILQLPGINPAPFVKKYLKLLNIDTTEGFVEGLPSITAINAAMTKAQTAPQPGTGDPASDPAAQGGEGADNAPQPGGNEQQSQAAFPTPGAGTAPMANQI